MNSGKLGSFVHGGDVYSAGSPLGHWLDFSANINPLGLSERVKQAITDNIEGLVHYPDPMGRALKQAVSASYNLPEKSVVLGNGAAELFYVYFHAMRPERVLLPVPSFSEYEKAARSADAEIKYFYLQEQDDFRLDFAGLQEAMDDCQAVVLGNPNNPTGELLGREAVEAFVRAAGKNGTDVMVDESFLDFRPDRQLYSVADLAAKYDNLLVVSSLTKAFAIPGLRLGYGTAAEGLVKKLDFSKDTWNVNSLAQAAGVAALADIGYKNRTLDFINENVPAMYRALQGIKGLKVYKPSVNFVLLNLSGCGMTSWQLAEKMKRHGVLIRDCSNYPGLDGRFVRLAVRGRDDNELMLNVLRECLGDEKHG
ncbi:threonine-phosphate decarboxylase CobD [Anaerovibrio sp.]|uniref:threonine-phosphate decarboxylase CobD n=1 Tax=Anaerovibrio sp. TaxID=1872532 RepID=UPI003F14EB6B